MLPGNKAKTLQFKLEEYPEIQFKAGTMDRESLKGCYLELKGCLESKVDDHNKNMFRFKKKLSGTVDRFLSDSLLSKNYLRTENISDSFNYTGFSFSTFEFTFFPKRNTNTTELTEELNKLVKLLYSTNIENNSEFVFHKNLYKGKRNAKSTC